ncbi:alpha/beta hydrolase [Rhodanobacter aciditrophus]|uniref:alpha/beta hydrolase n=1 Tax=Rhodanobacter aciditrophus TaxID=1623218 RepID=UPI003CE88341
MKTLLLSLAIGATLAATVLPSASAAPTPRAAPLPSGVREIHDVAYGAGKLERFDIYLPTQGAHDAPVIFMVHGGGWAHGDKTDANVVQNKVARWVPEGFILVSTDYPMLPEANPLQQAQFVGNALAAAQRMAGSWGGDRQRFILMGHSAGAHLVSLVSAEPALALERSAAPWLGTVALDSAAYDVTRIMQGPHLPLYDDAFGSDPAFWAAASPIVQLDGRIAPFFAVCSSLRRESCPQAQRFVAKADLLGTRASMQPEPLTHEEINADLGLPDAYTEAVEDFMRTLDPAVARRLDHGGQ